MKKYVFLSWGGGVQSTAMAVMTVLGDLPSVDAIIMADTGWERAGTVESVKFYKPWLVERGGHVEVVKASKMISVEAVSEHKHIPLWTIGGAPLRRQCTRYFKLVPIKHYIRKFMGFHVSLPPHPRPGSCEVMLGISWDEMERMKKSPVKYLVNRWPLLEQRITRTDCREYLESRGLPVPVKSSCVCCPYRDASTWAEIKSEKNSDYFDAVQFDEKIRNIRLGGVEANKLYLYKNRQPLSKVDFIQEAKKERRGKQLSMFCDGLCGL